MVLYKQSKVSERYLKVFLSQILHKSSTFVSKEKGQISMKAKIQAFLRRFSFRTGVIVLVLCVPCYIISFAQIWSRQEFSVRRSHYHWRRWCQALEGVYSQETLMTEHKADIESRTRRLPMRRCFHRCTLTAPPIPNVAPCSSLSKGQSLSFPNK